MNRDDVLRMAREAKFPVNHPYWADAAVRFAALVASAEREECAQVCDAASEPRKGYGKTDEQWAASTLAERIRARCAT